jgi:galactokinase
MDTRAPHTLADGGGYAARRAASERAAQVLGLTAPTGSLLATAGDLDAALARLDDEELRRRARHVITETARVREVVALLQEGRYTRIGPVLDASHTSMRDDYEISSPELDAVVAAAQTAGALGARMTGGGFGGSAVALVNADEAQEVAAAVAAAAVTAGHPEPAFLLAEASQGAARVR